MSHWSNSFGSIRHGRRCDALGVRHVPDIERLWKFLKRTTLRGHYYANFAEFKTAIESCLQQLPTTHKPKLETLMTLNFQTFPNVSLTAG